MIIGFMLLAKNNNVIGIANAKLSNVVFKVY